MSIAHILIPCFSSDGETIRPAPEATLTVYLAGTTTEATIYTSLAATATATQPISADSTALASAYVAPGVYDLLVTTATGTQTLSRHVAVGAIRVTDQPTDTESATVGDWGDVLQFDEAGDATLTLPEAPTVGYVVYSSNVGGGDVIFTPSGSDVIADSKTTGAAYTVTAAMYASAGLWVLIGSVT